MKTDLVKIFILICANILLLFAYFLSTLVSPFTKLAPMQLSRHLVFPILMLLTQISAASAQSISTSSTDAISIQERIDSLLSQMTIEEKIGQMTQINITLINNSNNQKDVSLSEEKLKTILNKWHVGSFLNGEASPASKWFNYMDRLTHIAMEESRLGIPVIYGIDHIHGASYMGNAVLFPQSITLSGSFNPQLAYTEGKITVIESADVGHHWIFAPVLDIARNPLWPRFWETYGEDPFLASRMGEAFVRGIQEPHPEITPYQVAACAKHFIGYSDPYSGWDRSPAELSMQTIQEMHRPSFQAAVNAGIKTFMINSGEVNGIPVHASKELLTDLLRNQMGFDGVIVTDWSDIEKLINYHHVAHNWKEATKMAIDAGIDMSMTPLNFKFNTALLELVQEGSVSEARIDSSVSRILKLKFDLGLFEHPYPRNDRFERIGSEEHQKLALEAVNESLILLKNKKNTLPLIPESTKHIVLVGPSVNSKTNLNGGWTLRWQGGKKNSDFPEWVKTVEQAIKAEYPKTKIDVFESIGKAKSKESKQFEKAAKKADAVIYVGGEKPYTEFVGNISDLRLEQTQLDEIEKTAFIAKKTILILVEGRPRIITDIIKKVDALVFAGLPGFMGADGIAQTLSGKNNPNGKLSFTYPAYPNHHIQYNHKPGAVYFFKPDQANFIQQDEKTTSLYDFGDGLSYTEFSYSDLKISSDSLTNDGQITASVKVKNVGKISGKESVLWFLTDKVGKISRPLKELKHFEKIELQPGEEKSVTFRIEPVTHLSYPNRNGERLLENGEFILQVANQKTTFHLK